MPEAVIVEALRTPIARGKMGKGELSGIHPVKLLGTIQRAVVERAGIAPTEVEQIVKEGGKESTRTLKPGEILWVDKVTHDHKVVKSGTAVLITLK